MTWAASPHGVERLLDALVQLGHLLRRLSCRAQNVGEHRVQPAVKLRVVDMDDVTQHLHEDDEHLDRERLA